MANPLSTLQLANYAKLFDPRSNFNNACKRIHTAYELGDLIIPGQGVQTLKRTVTQCDFQPGGATGETGRLKQDLGYGALRNPYYNEFEGILIHQIVAPYETIEATDGPIYRVNDTHVREMDQRTAQIYSIYMEGLFPFTGSGDFLPFYDVTKIMPLEPDERPEEMREINIARVRHMVRWRIRESALPE